MKRVFCGILAALLIGLLPGTALAEETAAPGGDTPVIEQPEQATLAIDNTNVYDGMDKAYRDGYLPTVANGRAVIILPLVCDTPLSGDQLSVTPSLGEPSMSPFVFRNYDMTVGLGEHSVNGGTGTVSAYLVRLELELSADRTNGAYPVTVNVKGTTAEKSTVQQSFTIYVTITDGKSATATEMPVEEPQSRPQIMVDSYAINPSPAIAGEAFELTLTLKNTSSEQNTQNLKITMSNASGMLYPTDGKTAIYHSGIKRGSTAEFTLSFDVDANTATTQELIAFQLEYEDSDAQMITATAEVRVPIQQPVRIEIEHSEIPTEIAAGETFPISLQIMNLGKGALNNVRCELTGDGLRSSATAFIGNIPAGTAGQGNMNIFAGTKSEAEGERYGYTNGTLTVLYEDELGTEYTETVDFSLTINAPIISTVTEPDDTQQQAETQWWIVILIGAVVLAGAVVVYIVLKKKREKKYESQ